MANTRSFAGAVFGLLRVSSQCPPGWISAAIITFVVVAVGMLTTTQAQAQNRAALCESESDAERVFAYLQTAVEAGDRAGANTCADVYLELAPRGAHVREANELVASMLYRPDVSLHASPPDVPLPAVGQSQDITGWLVLGVSGAFVVAGVVLLGVAASNATKVANYSGPRWSDVSDDYDRIPTLAGVGWTALALGVVGAGIGIALQVTSDSSDRGLSLQIQPGGLVLRGAF